MKKLLSYTIVGSLALAGAVHAAPLKIGVIDMQKVMRSSTQVKAINKKLEQQFKPRQTKILALQKKLKADMEKIERDSAIMSNTDKVALQTKAMQEKRDLNRMGQDYQQDVSVAQNQMMQKFFKKLHGKISVLAKKEGYDLVLQKNAIPYSNPSIDITDVVLKKLG